MLVRRLPDMLLFEAIKEATPLEIEYIIDFCRSEDAEKLRKELLRAALTAKRLSTSVPALPPFIREGVDTLDSLLAPLTPEAKQKLIIFLWALYKMEPATHMPATILLIKMLEFSEYLRNQKNKK